MYLKFQIETSVPVDVEILENLFQHHGNEQSIDTTTKISHVFIRFLFKYIGSSNFIIIDRWNSSIWVTFHTSPDKVKKTQSAYGERNCEGKS